MIYQVKNRLMKPKFRAQAFHIVGRHTPKWSVEPIPRPKCTEEDKFTFINIPSEFTGWNDASRGMLWAYNLNYFDFINEACDGSRGLNSLKDSSREYGVYWIDKFITELPSNEVGLDPYPIALRGINWIKFFGRYPDTMIKKRIDSLYSQYKLLQKKLEYHLLGNHLLEDFYSLYIMSIFFDDEKYNKWVTKKLLAELDEEILKDGGHYEQSVMYHCILLDRLLDCINFASGSKSLNGLNCLRGYASQMLGWLEAMCFEDGSYPLFNDAAMCIAPMPDEIFDYARRLGIDWGKCELNESGYRRLSSEGIEAIVDVGNITATYQPGHTHADTFNYELRIDGKPFVVDTGISTYNKTARRQYERSTEAHNTVTIGGKDSSEVWGGFRVGKRAKAVGDTCITSNGEKHKRLFALDEEGFHVTDEVSAPAVSRIHLAPEVEVKVEKGLKSLNGLFTVETNLGTIVIEGAKDVKIVDCHISREYNRLLDAKCIEIEFENHLRYSININK